MNAGTSAKGDVCRVVVLAASAALLALLWLGPLPPLARHMFSAHMALHMGLVAVVAPLLAWGLGGSRLDPVRIAPALFAPIPASIVELIVVWSWHAPALHQAARRGGSEFAFEQATFLASGLLLWLAALGGTSGVRPWRAWAGVAALLFTSIHMTLLGALFALSSRTLYAHPPGTNAWGLDAVTDQQLGGAIMLLIGGAAYLAGGLWLTARVVRTRTREGTDYTAGRAST